MQEHDWFAVGAYLGLGGQTADVVLSTGTHGLFDIVHLDANVVNAAVGVLVQEAFDGTLIAKWIQKLKTMFRMLEIICQENFSIRKYFNFCISQFDKHCVDAVFGLRLCKRVVYSFFIKFLITYSNTIFSETLVALRTFLYNDMALSMSGTAMAT